MRYFEITEGQTYVVRIPRPGTSIGRKARANGRCLGRPAKHVQGWLFRVGGTLMVLQSRDVVRLVPEQLSLVEPPE